jgi:hypothetical protein
MGLALVDDALTHVLLERRRHRERHLAEPAPVDVLPDPAVGLHVPGQLRTLRTRVRTQLALVRLLAGVGAPVDSQIRTVLEHFPAELAGVVASARLFFDEGVGEEGAGAGETFSLAGEPRQPPVVALQVELEPLRGLVRVVEGREEGQRLRGRHRQQALGELVAQLQLVRQAGAVVVVAVFAGELQLQRRVGLLEGLLVRLAVLRYVTQAELVHQLPHQGSLFMCRFNLELWAQAWSHTVHL